MNLTDPIADMLTRIRNANQAKHATVDIPFSKIKSSIADILLNEGYISKIEVLEDGVIKNIRVTLKYIDNERVLQGLKRISRPGLRIHANNEELPRVLNGLGIAIISTSKGIMTDKSARKLNIGGEVLAYIW
ncbi:MAG: 30S ribosomal protein S8 [Clostridia bacterium]